jgi:3-oxoacyl-[acyl-carrier protein] reductase
VRRHFDTNVLGTILMIQEVLAHLGPYGGCIINIGSVASVSPRPGSVIYSATKGAVATLTRVLAVVLGGRHIRVRGNRPLRQAGAGEMIWTPRITGNNR